MEAREYILGLMAIISGLAISDMVQSLHGLLERARRVRWAWAPLATAAFVLVTIVYSWWAAWEADLVPISLWAFLLLLGQQIALFLAAKAALPDPAPGDHPVGGLDLGAWYAGSSRYIYVALLVCMVLVHLLAAVRMEPGAWRGWAVERTPAAVAIAALALWRWRPLHLVLPPLLIVVTLWRFGGVMLGD